MTTECKTDLGEERANGAKFFLGDFSRHCQVALEYFRIVMLSDYRGIWEQWQKRNPNQSWSLNNLWDMCYACCISRYVGVEEAARAADYASNKNFWLK